MSKPMPRFLAEFPGNLPRPAILAMTLLMWACAAELPSEPESTVGNVPQLAKGKGGKPGVTPGPVELTPLSITFADREGDRIRSDGLLDKTYSDGVCGVAAHFNSTSDDAILDPDDSRVKRSERAVCGSEPRAIHFNFGLDLGPDLVTSTGGFMNIDSVRVVEAVEAGMDPVLRRTQFNIQPCNRLVFDPDEFDGTNHVEVKRVDDSTWLVTAEPDFAVGYCVDLDVFIDMPFQVTITLRNP